MRNTDGIDESARYCAMFTSFSVARNASGVVNDQGMRIFRFPIISPSYQPLLLTAYTILLIERERGSKTLCFYIVICTSLPGGMR